MEDLIFVLAEIIPVEVLVDRVEGTCSNYRNNPTEDNLRSLYLCCALLLSKNLVDTRGGVDRVSSIIKDFKQFNETKEKQTHGTTEETMVDDTPSIA